MNYKTTDVLIIGSGGAGLSAALEAKGEGVEVLVASKTYPTHSQTCQAQGGINAVINNKQNSIQAHIDDTIKGSHQLFNQKAIQTMCQEAPKTIKWLDQLGVPFSRDENHQVAQRKFGAASEIRTCFSSDYTGLKILHTLYDNCIKENINFLNEYQLLNIIKEKNSAIGASFLSIETGEIIEVFAKTVIIATGGYANLYNKFTTNSHSTTGDGIVAAFNAGCELSNMEMIQFHPTAMEGNNILISESARGEGGYLIDEKGKRFIDELRPRDEVARAIYEKMERGDRVYLDLRHIDKDKLLSFMPQEYRLAKEFLNIELDKDSLPINPAAHYCMGGIKTNVSCETNIKNLYAVGESAQNGLHGANRLGGNSLQEIITFGRIAGKNAAKKCSTSEITIKENSKAFLEIRQTIHELLSEENSKNFYDTKTKMGDIFFKKVGLFRCEEQLNEAKEFIHSIDINNYGLQDRSKLYNKNLVEYLEFKNLLILAEVVVESALWRKESRGAHYRTDYVNEEENYIQNTIAKLSKDGVTIYGESL